MLCEFFKHGCCSKTADKCKYSHQLDIAQRQQKRSVFEVPDEDSIEMWDQKKLEAVIARKHGQEVNSNNETTIVCKHFLDAVEKKLYGWFWHCPGERIASISTSCLRGTSSRASCASACWLSSRRGKRIKTSFAKSSSR